MPVHAKKSLVIDALKRAMLAAAEQAFLESQRKVPVITGRLKSSGNIIKMDNSVLIQYLEKYACIYPCSPNIDGKKYPYIIGEEGEKRALIHLKPGIMVKNGFGKNNEVIAIDKKKVYRPNLFKIITESGKVLILTDNHFLPTENKGLIQVKDLEVGDNVFTEEPTKRHICWDKNLTKETNESLRKISIKNTGIKRSEKTKDQMRKNHWSTKKEHSFNYSGDAEIECYFCKKVFIKSQSFADKAKGRHFCTKECEKRWRKQFYYGKNNPRYGKLCSQVKYGGGGYRDDIDHYVRSTWEANFARVLKAANIKYAYEPIRFYAEDCTYCPDFWLIDEDIYIEVGVSFVKKKNGSFEKMKKILEKNPELKEKLFMLDEEGYSKIKEMYQGVIKEWE